MRVVSVESLQAEQFARRIGQKPASTLGDRGLDAHLHITRTVTCAACGQPPEFANWNEHGGDFLLRQSAPFSQPDYLDNSQWQFVSRSESSAAAGGEWKDSEPSIGRKNELN